MVLLVSLELKKNVWKPNSDGGVGRTTGEMVSQSESLGAEWGPKDHASVKVSLHR